MYTSIFQSFEHMKSNKTCLKLLFSEVFRYPEDWGVSFSAHFKAYNIFSHSSLTIVHLPIHTLISLLPILILINPLPPPSLSLSYSLILIYLPPSSLSLCSFSFLYTFFLHHLSPYPLLLFPYSFLYTLFLRHLSPYLPLPTYIQKGLSFHAVRETPHVHRRMKYNSCRKGATWSVYVIPAAGHG